MSKEGGILRNSAPLRAAGEEELNNDFGGTGNFAQKAEMLEKEAETRIALDDLLEVGTYFRKFLAEDLPKFSASTYKTVKSGLTPGFIKRMNRKKIHLKYVNEKEEKLNHLHEDAEHVMEEEKRFTKTEKERAKLIAEMLKYKQQVKDEENVVLDAAKADIAELEFREFHRRREEQMKEKEEKEAKLQQELKEKQEKEEQDLRDWRVSFYSSQAKIFGEEAAMLSPAKVHREKNEESLQRIKTEWVDREQSRIRMQVEPAPHESPRNDLPPPVADKVLYGFERKKYKLEGIDEYDDEGNDHPSTKENDLLIEEVDDSHHEVHLFDSKSSHIGYETKVIEEYDSKSALIQQQALYDALERDVKEMKEAIARMYDMKEIIEREQKQITEEIVAIEIEQKGPPKRLAMSHEIPAMDLWKQRAAQAKKNLQDLQYAIDKAERKRGGMSQQSLSIAKNIATLKEKDKEIERSKLEFNDGFGQLPMIVGRSITKIPGLNIMANAGEFTQAVIQKSKLINMKSDSEQAISLHKENLKMDQEMWVTRLEETSARNELESVITRIAAIGERLQKSKTETLKLNLVDALKGFLASGIKLKNIKKKAVGIIPWFKHHDFTRSVNIVRYITNNAMGAIVFDEEEDEEESEEEKENGEMKKGFSSSQLGVISKSQSHDHTLVGHNQRPTSSSTVAKKKSKKKDYAYGVTLGTEYHGVCAGSLMLPKDTLWIISVTITKQGRGNEHENPFDQDSVTVEFGPTQTSLQTVGVYYNCINPQTGTILYDVKYVFRGNQFAYKFTFHSLTNELKKHLAVCTGIFEEYEIQELELVSDPKNLKKTRVLSSYVKMIRMEEKKGKLRETKLLEELIDVEGSSSPYWDSQTLNFTLQRYSKEYFLRILKAEILLQQQIAIKQREKQQFEEEFEIVSQTSSVVNEAENKANKLRESSKRYVMKKRGAQQALITEAEKLIAKRLVLWDPKESRWRNILVNDVTINWVDNGLVAQIIHKVQEFNDINEMVGKEKEINLSKFKFFISPIQQFDEQMIAKMKEKLKWENEIKALQQRQDEERQECDNQFKKYEKKSHKYWKTMKADMIQRFEENVPEQAEKAIKKNAAKKRIKEEYYPNVMLDMRKGIIEVDLKKESAGNVRKLARSIARERYMNDWIEEKRQDLMNKLQAKEDEMKEAIKQKFQELERKKLFIEQYYQGEIAKIKQFLRKQYFIHRNKLAEQLKFPKEVFSKVLPISYHCEHLRTKAWGDLYGKGVKCLQCGKELSELHNEESQVMGFGSGGNRELFLKYRQHYENEENYRPANNFELMILEKERLRLEKERRELQEQEQYFYDFQDLRVIYEFDRRHAREIKKHGIFRQGLQWTKDELETYEQRKIIKEEIRLRDEGLPVENLIGDYDALADIENPPPTFRAEEERHYSQYKDLLYYIGRLQNFSKKIEEMKKKRFTLIYDKKVYSTILESLHQESYQNENQLIELEKDLDRTSQLLAIYAKMEKLWLQANMITHQAKKNKMKIEMNQIYYPYEIKGLKDELNLIHYEMKNLLKTKILTERKIDHLEKEVSFYSDVYAKQKEAYEENEEKLQRLKICMPGNMVYTKLFGLVYIVSYRSSDDMVLVSLPFGKPAAKAYIYYREIAEIALKRQENELLLMGKEDERMQGFFRQEKILIKKELYLMAREEENIRKIYEFLDLNKYENQLKQKRVEETVAMAYEITESKRYAQLQRPNAIKRLQSIVEDRRRRNKAYIGPKNNRPKLMSTYEQYQQRKKIEIELKEVYLMRMANDADNDVTIQLYENRQAWLLDYLFDQLISTGIKEMIGEIAYEAIQEGKEAKATAEKKTGIFFPNLPNYLSYGTYHDLSNLWQGRKNALKEQIMLNESAIQKLILTLQNKIDPNAAGAKGGSAAAKEKKLWLLKNPNYNNNKKLAKLYWDVTKKTKQYQNVQAGMGSGSSGGSNNQPSDSSKGSNKGKAKDTKEEEVVIDGHAVQKKQASNYEKKKAKKLMKRLKQLELERQERLCYEMFQEELACKTFYAWELKENLRERRQMKEEEKLGLMIRKEEQKLKKAIAERMLLLQKQRQQKSGGIGVEDDFNEEELLKRMTNEDMNQLMSSELVAKRDLSLTYEKRRKELKDLTLERRRRTEDQRLMILEDELSYQLRELDKIERQKKAYEQEFGKDEEEGEAGVEVDENGNKIITTKKDENDITSLIQQFANQTEGIETVGVSLGFTREQSEKIIQSIRPNDKLLSTKQLPIPDWLFSSLPKRFNDLPILERNQYLKIRVTVNEKQKKITKQLQREEKRLLRLEQRSYKEWEIKYRLLEQITRKSELLMIESQEELYISSNQLQTIMNNIDKISIFCREIGEKELKYKTKYLKFIELYSLGQDEYKESCDWYNICLKRNKNRDKLKRRIVSNCQFIDSESINGFYQRFETHRLRERVYMSYFNTIIQSIIHRSEMIATERKLMLLQHLLSENKYYLINREKSMHLLKRELKCSEYNRMRRSLLNQTFFPKNRYNILSNALKGWIRFYYWNRGNKNAYKLKYEIIKRQLDIDRQFKKQLAIKQHHQESYSNDPNTNSPSAAVPPTPPSLMHRVRERPVQCKHCYNFYIASQNHSLACAYHPETYQLQCPETCPQPGLTALCSVHRKKRWGCCRLTDQNAIGCARRYHTPPESDPVFDYIMEKINERDAKELEEVEEQIKIAREEKYPEKVKILQRNQLMTIEKELEDARGIAARYKNLKFV